MFCIRILFLLIFPLHYPIFGYDWTGVDVAESSLIMDPLDTYDETELDLTEAKQRYKRQTDSAWNNTLLDLSIGTDVVDKAELGDSYDFTLRVQFPEITVSSPFSVVILNKTETNAHCTKFNIIFT